MSVETLIQAAIMRVDLAIITLWRCALIMLPLAGITIIAAVHMRKFRGRR